MRPSNVIFPLSIVLILVLMPCAAGETNQQNMQQDASDDGLSVTAESPVYPTGIYCSDAPTTNTSRSVNPTIAAKNFVSGFLLRVQWCDLEPQEGVYDWTLPDNEIANASMYGKNITLAVLGGQNSPSWLTPKCEMFDYLFHSTPVSMPVPWNETYLSAWTAFIQKLGEHYNNDTSVVLVHMTHSTANGFEMQLPFTAPDISAWTAIGYTDQKVIDSWKIVLDAFSAAFPSKPLDLEVHPVLYSDAVAQGVASYGNSTIGERFGLFAGWWGQHNALDVYSGMYTLLCESANDTYSTVQFVTSGTNNPDGFGTGGIQGAIDLAIDSGIRYMEIWNTDLLNPAFEAMLIDTESRIDAAVPEIGMSVSGFYSYMLVFGALLAVPMFVHSRRER